MSGSLSDGAGKVSDQASDTMSDTLSDASFFTTPDAPEVQFLDSVQASLGLGQSPKPLRLRTPDGRTITGCVHSASRYHVSMIKSCCDKKTKKLAAGERSRKSPPDIQRSAKKRLGRIHATSPLEDCASLHRTTWRFCRGIRRASTASASTINGGYASLGKRAMLIQLKSWTIASEVIYEYGRSNHPHPSRRTPGRFSGEIGHYTVSASQGYPSISRKDS